MVDDVEAGRSTNELSAATQQSAKALSGLTTIGPLLAAARALSGLHPDEIAKRSMLGSATIRRAESARTKLTPANLDRLVSTYAELGITFFSDAAGLRGVAATAARWLPVQEPRPRRRAPRLGYRERQLAIEKPLGDER